MIRVKIPKIESVLFHWSEGNGAMVGTPEDTAITLLEFRAILCRVRSYEKPGGIGYCKVSASLNLDDETSVRIRFDVTADWQSTDVDAHLRRIIEHRETAA